MKDKIHAGNIYHMTINANMYVGFAYSAYEKAKSIIVKENVREIEFDDGFYRFEATEDYTYWNPLWKCTEIKLKEE